MGWWFDARRVESKAIYGIISTSRSLPEGRKRLLQSLRGAGLLTALGGEQPSTLSGVGGRLGALTACRLPRGSPASADSQEGFPAPNRRRPRELPPRVGGGAATPSVPRGACGSPGGPQGRGGRRGASCARKRSVRAAALRGALGLQAGRRLLAPQAPVPSARNTDEVPALGRALLRAGGFTKPMDSSPRGPGWEKPQRNTEKARQRVGDRRALLATNRRRGLGVGEQPGGGQRGRPGPSAGRQGNTQRPW